MADFHKPRISGIALYTARRLILEQSDPRFHTKGQILALPIYEGKPAATLAAIVAVSRRVGWRYVFVAGEQSACSNAVVDFGKSVGGRPILRSYANSRLAQKLIEILRKFETEQAVNDHSYYIDLLTIPALNFEIVWFRDAARKHPNDFFDALTATRFAEETDEEISARFRAFRAGSRDIATDG